MHITFSDKADAAAVVKVMNGTFIGADVPRDERLSGTREAIERCASLRTSRTTVTTASCVRDVVGKE